MSKLYRVPLGRRIWGLYVPTAAPYAVKEWSAALSFSLKLVVSAEVLANTYISPGGMMQQARIFVEVPELFALTILTVLTGFLLETATGFFAWLIRRKTA
jgi:ABC-type nitrate/sulfonate/bicarbonate transport system permease component